LKVNCNECPFQANEVPSLFRAPHCVYCLMLKFQSITPILGKNWFVFFMFKVRDKQITWLIVIVARSSHPHTYTNDSLVMI
jgi:hypothetical protein